MSTAAPCPCPATPARARGAAVIFVLVAVVVGVLAAVWFWLDGDMGGDVRKRAQLAAIDVIGDAAVKRLGEAAGQTDTHGSAVDLIQRPIEVIEVAENVYLTTGVGNVVMITTPEGNVVFDTGLAHTQHSTGHLHSTAQYQHKTSRNKHKGHVANLFLHLSMAFFICGC